MLLATMGVTSCTEYEPDSWTCHTESYGNLSYVLVIVEGPGLEAEYWEIRVSMWYYPRSGGYPDDEITLHLRQADCLDNEILIEGHVRGDGTLHDVEHSSHWLEEPCSDVHEEQTWHPESGGTVTSERSEGYVSIEFDHLHISNPSPADPPSISSITLDGLYRAPVTCLEAP